METVSNRLVQIKKSIVLFVLSLCVFYVHAQKGKNGAASITLANTIINQYTFTEAIVSAGSTTADVDNTIGFATGDLALIIQMQGAEINSANDPSFGTITDYHNAGKYEFNVVASVSGNTIIFNCPFANTYDYKVSVTGINGSALVSAGTQIIKVPRYTSLTVQPGASITAPAWNGKTGGVAVVEASGDILMNGEINVSGKGFRGASSKNYSANNTTSAIPYVTTNAQEAADKGEGIAGFSGIELADKDTILATATFPGYTNTNVFYASGQIRSWKNQYGHLSIQQLISDNSVNGFIPQELAPIVSNETPSTHAYTAYGRFGIGAPANGGGGGASHNAGGGGGSNAGTGPWTGKGIADRGAAMIYDNAWNLETAGFATMSSSGGGRGGYTYSQNSLDPRVNAPGNFAWEGNNRRIAGGLGGRPLDYASGRIFFGGGGGAGDANDNCGTSGSNGGGIVYLLTDGTIGGSGSVQANGLDAPNAYDMNPSCIVGSDAPSGAGGGGAIILNAMGGVSGITSNANGGRGGNQDIRATNEQPYEAEGPGGGGGGGYIAVSTGSITSNTTGGDNGVTNASGDIGTYFPPNGATKGANGSTGTVQPVIECILPVVFVQFELKAENNTVIIHWSTASEQHADYYSIERSSDGIHFESIGLLKAAGNSNALLSYQYIDNDPLEADAYYKIKEVDYDNTFSETMVKSIPAESIKDVQISPNPTSNLVQISFKGISEADFYVTDVLGKIVYATEHIMGSGASIDMSAFSTGVYLFCIQTTQEKFIYKIIKE